MTGQVIAFPTAPEMALDEILAELAFPPDSLFLNPGETLADRMPHYLAKGRAKEAERRRAGFKVAK